MTSGGRLQTQMATPGTANNSKDIARRTGSRGSGAVSAKRLGDIINLKRGYDLPATKRNKGPYPVLSSSGVSGYHDEYKVSGPGVVTGRYGALGEVYFVDGRYWPHNTALYVTDFKGNAPRYVYYLMKCLGNLQTSDKSTVPGVPIHDVGVTMQ